MRRLLMEGQYGDYMIQAYEAGWIHGGMSEMVNGFLAYPLGILFPCGWAPAGGAMHSNNVEAALNQLPGLELYTVSDPQTYYELLNYMIRFGYNPYAIVYDYKLLNQPKTWVKGSGLFQPGRDRIVQNGRDLQIITWGPMTSVVKKAASQVQNELNNQVKIGILDKVSWKSPGIKDFITPDLVEFLSSSDAPIIIASEDFNSRSLANQLVAQMTTNPQLISVTNGRLGEDSLITSKDRAQPPCDEILMAAARPGLDQLTTAFRNALG